MLVVDAKRFWPCRKCLWVAAWVAATSVCGLLGVDLLYVATDYDLSDWIFVPLFMGAGLAYPVIVVARSYKHLPSPVHALWFAVGFGLEHSPITCSVSTAKEVVGAFFGFYLVECVSNGADKLADLSWSVST